MRKEVSLQTLTRLNTNTIKTMLPRLTLLIRDTNQSPGFYKDIMALGDARDHCPYISR